MVIAVIAILASLLLPALAKAKAQANHDARYMPHRIGMNVVAADNHVERIKGNLKEEDWWVYHSKEGWDP